MFLQVLETGLLLLSGICLLHGCLSLGRWTRLNFQFLAFEASQEGRKSIACPVLYLSVGNACRWGAVGSPDHCPLGSPASCQQHWVLVQSGA